MPAALKSGAGTMPDVSKFQVVLAVTLLFSVAGCGDDKPDPNAVAAAKCHLPLVEHLKPTSEPGVDESAVEVRDLGNGRREVTGSVTVLPDGPTKSFVCVVTPDASDKLRGLRVERLDVT
jgi:hypothetical protein